MTISPKKIWFLIGRSCFILTTLIPTVFLLGVVSYTLRSRWHLGYWPSPSRPDPNWLPFDDFHYELVHFFLMPTLLTPIVFPLLRYAARKTTCNFAYGSQNLIFILSWILVLVMLFFSPVDFLTWFLD